MARLRMRPNTMAWVLLGVTALLLSLGVLWPLLAQGPGGPSTVEARQAVAASNHSAITAGLISQTRFPPYHPGAASHPPGVEGDSGDNLLVLALSSTAFLFMASLPLLMWRKVRRVGELGQPHSANLVERSLPVAPSVGS